MKKTLLLHDLNIDNVEKILKKNNNELTVISPKPTIKPCMGCFNCWVKTPGKCIIPDGDSNFAVMMPYQKEVIVVSRLVFGGFSPDIKAIFDRSIGFMLPYFCNLNNEMHHVQRYENPPNLRYLFYGDKIRNSEKNTAKKLIIANTLNFGAKKYAIAFYNSPKEIMEVLS